MLIVAFVYADEYIPLLEQYVNESAQEEVSNNETINDRAVETAAPEIEGENVIDLIGLHPEQVMGMYGEPTRVDPSAYGYDWWVYKTDDHSYMQVGIDGDRVVSVYSIGQNVNTAPFVIGQSRSEVAKAVKIEREVELREGLDYYRFQLNDEDLKMRPLVKYDGVYIQLYFDQFLNTLSSIRVMDSETLMKQKPYEVMYRGSFPEVPSLSQEEWKEIEDGASQQIIDLTNVIRKRHGKEALSWDEDTAKVAYLHSKEMSDLEYFAHESPVQGDLGNRLQKGDVLYRTAGENIASNYTDGPAAVEGWLNSEGHRKAILNNDFTHLGVGVYEKFYTQNFITPLK
ncbi:MULTISPECIES: CAP domain-containing protein [Bacillaceae]|uniref:CAP domain-containing protein n=1 Tax=Bacillaceae TaxID=186817 RepID=UPI000A75EDD9|nr:MULTISPECIES: CAP domain-containing protein [Bacillaceae]